MAIYDVLAVICDTGKQRIARMMETGKSWKVTHFATGDAGFDPANPPVPIPPDPTLLECPQPTSAFAPVAGYTEANPYCPIWTCLLPAGTGTGSLSSVCLIGTILWSPIPADPEIGTQFLVAFGTRGQVVKGAMDNWTIRVGLFW